MPRGRPKGSKNKKPLVAATKQAKPKEAAPAKKKASGRPKGSKNKATIARQEERQQRAQHIDQPEIKLGPTLQRLSAEQIKGQEKLTWGKWPEVDVPVYIAGHGSRQYSFACPFESGNDGGVLVVDYKERHHKIPSAKYRVESRFVYYKPTAK